jgi:hypothetical protein
MIAIKEYDLGDAPRCFGEFRNFAGELADPDTVKVSVKDPAGTITTKIYGTDAAVIKASTGVYYIDVNANAVGSWAYRWFSEGTGQAAAERKFRVKSSEFDE